MTKKDIFFSDISEIGLSKQPVSTHSPTKLSRGAKVDEIRDIKDIAKAVREYVKKKYPNCKFSVSIERYSGGQSMTVSLQEADFNPLTDESYWEKSSDGNKYFSVNQYHFEKSDKLTPEAISVLKDVRDFYNQFNYNHSDSSTDYFNVRFYENLTIGKWDKGFVQVGKKPKTPRTPKPAPEKGGKEPKFAVGTKVIYKTSKGSEDGKIIGSKYIGSRESYLYQVENPRGGQYNIWESNIVSEMPQPKEKWTEKEYLMFKNWIAEDRPILEEISTKNLFRATSVEDGEFVIENLFSNDRISFTPTNYYEEFFKKFTISYPNDEYSKKVKYIWVWWSENADLDSGLYVTWNSFQNKLKTLNLDYGGYDKTKVTIVWENYRVIIDRIDIGKSEGDFDPNREFIGDYLSKQTQAHFWSNFSGERTKEALWRDTEEMPELPTPEPEPTPDPESKFAFKEGEVYARNMEGEETAPKITYTILSIGAEKTQYRIDYTDKGTSRLSTKSNDKIQEEIDDKWWVLYKPLTTDQNSLEEAIIQLRDENDLVWNMYSDSDDKVLRKELRQSANENGVAINDFSADLFFDPLKFMNDYFLKATEKFAYDNSELTIAEYEKITTSKEFLNWFGDFRQPLQDSLCSKVVKATFEDDKSMSREPIIVYHGTWNKAHFSRFKFTKFPVIYFATNKSYAEWFAKIGSGIIYQCFLDIKFLCDFRDLGLRSVSWGELSNFLFEQYGFSLPERETKGATLPAWAWIRNDAPNFALINTIKEQGFTGMAHIEDNPQDILPNGEKNSTTAYMIFSPEQAKLVRYVSSGNAFTDIFFMKKGGKVSNALIQRIKNLKV
jgi:hypothetical protein